MGMGMISNKSKINTMYAKYYNEYRIGVMSVMNIIQNIKITYLVTLESTKAYYEDSDGHDEDDDKVMEQE